MTRIISFYSYKGGAGRTVLIANMAGVLTRAFQATMDRPLLLIDMDLDSAGLTILLEQIEAAKSGEYWTAAGVVNGEPHFNVRSVRKELRSKTIDISRKLGVPEGSVRFIPGVPVGEEPLGVRMGDAGQNLRDLQHLVCDQQQVPVMLLDSASGRQVSACVSHHVAHVVVYCTRLSYQFAIGTADHANFFIEQSLKGIDPDRTPPHIVFVPMAVPASGSAAFENQRISRMDHYRNLARKLREKSRSDCRVFEAGMPEVERFKWIEGILAMLDDGMLDDDARMAKAAYENLGRELVELCHASDDADSED